MSDRIRNLTALAHRRAREASAEARRVAEATGEAWLAAWGVDPATTTWSPAEWPECFCCPGKPAGVIAGDGLAFCQPCHEALAEGEPPP